MLLDPGQRKARATGCLMSFIVDIWVICCKLLAIPAGMMSCLVPTMRNGNFNYQANVSIAPSSDVFLVMSRYISSDFY